jgi:WD40 repeat protein
VTLSPDWSTASGLKDGRIAMWDVETRSVRRYLAGGSGRPYWAAGGWAAFSPDGRRLAAGNRAEPIEVWDLGEAAP